MMLHSVLLWSCHLHEQICWLHCFTNLQQAESAWLLGKVQSCKTIRVWLRWKKISRKLFGPLTTNLEYQMKSNYKTTSTTPRVNRETNLMRPLTAWLEDGYCSITVANHQLITVIIFISKSYTHPWKSFANRLHLVLYAEVRCFVKSWQDRLPNTAYMFSLAANRMKIYETLYAYIKWSICSVWRYI